MIDKNDFQKYGINPLRAAARLQRLQKRGYREEHRMSKQDYDTKEKIHKWVNGY